MYNKDKKWITATIIIFIFVPSLFYAGDELLVFDSDDIPDQLNTAVDITDIEINKIPNDLDQVASLNTDIDIFRSNAYSPTIKPPVHPTLIEPPIPEKSAKPDDHRFAVPISAHYSFANRSFDNDDSKTTLSNLIFNKDFTIQDIFLLSKLSIDGKVSNSVGGSVGPNRGAAPLLGNQLFGAFSDDFFTTLLAPVKVNIDTEHRELAVDASFMYRFNISDWERVNGAVGFTVPLKSRLHLMQVKLVGGQIRSLATDGLLDTLQFRAFFQEFASVDDFFERGVLEPKGLQFEQRQRKNGFGDITGFVLLDFAGFSDCLDGMQVGMNLVVPSGGRPDPDTVWDLVLGNGGFFQIDLFAHSLIKTRWNFLNPTLRIVGQLGTHRSICRRVPKQKTNAKNAVINTIPDLIAPVFEMFRADPFSEFDTSVLHFADQAVKTRTRLGHKVILGFGNYFYNVFDLPFRFGLLYEFMHKGKDDVEVKDAKGTFNTDLLEQRSKQRAHTLGWDLTYKFENSVEVNVGSQHVVGGKNMPRNHEIFASVVAIF